MELQKKLMIAAIAPIMAAAALPASADPKPHHILRGGVAWMSPDGDQTLDLDGTDVEVTYDSSVGAFFEYEWRFSRFLGLPVNVGWAQPDASFQVPGAGPVTEGTQVLTGAAGLYVHPFGRGWIDWYLGAYGQYATFDNEVDDALGYGAAIGCDFSLGKRFLAINVSLRYSLLSPEVSGTQGVSGLDELDFDPLVGQVGLSWRF